MAKNIMHSAFVGAEKTARGLVHHNIQIGARRTSVRIDRLTWRSLHEIAQLEGVTVHELCMTLNAAKPPSLSLTVAIRVGILQYYRDAATERGHRQAGHGKAALRHRTID